MAGPYRAYRAERIIPLRGEKRAVGAALEAPAKVVRDGVLLTRDGVTEAVEPYATYRRRGLPGAALVDLGNVCMTPGLVNAHCHLELSWLAGKTRSGGGFAQWLRSLIASLREPLPDASDASGVPDGLDTSDTAEEPIGNGIIRDAGRKALWDMLDNGMVHVGDVGSRNTRMICEAAGAARAERGLPYPVTHFLEAFGFGPPENAGAVPEFVDADGYTPLCAAAVPDYGLEHCAVAGHALYSTGPEAMRAAQQWCARRNKPFSMHLAESEEEEEALYGGTGPLHDIFRTGVLPREWKAPGMGSVSYADSLGLLTPGTLAVHCVQCSETDIALLAGRRTAVCLCPRSNTYIGVGAAPALKMAEAGVLLCVGTDGLSSNHDLDLRMEVIALCDKHGFSPFAALRTATVNGAAVFGLHAQGTLEPGRHAAFSLWEPAVFF